MNLLNQLIKNDDEMNDCCQVAIYAVEGIDELKEPTLEAFFLLEKSWEYSYKVEKEDAPLIIKRNEKLFVDFLEELCLENRV